LFGAIFANGLHANLAGILPPAAIIPSDAASIATLPPAIRASYINAVVTALRPVFLVAAAVAALGFVLTLMLREIPLRGVAPAEGLGESFAMPRDATSLAELERIVRVLMARENRWRVYADLAARSRLDLPAPELWLLARLGERKPMTAQSLSEELRIPLDQLEALLNALCDRDMVGKGTNGQLQLTALGLQMRERVLTARRQGLDELLKRWEPEKHPDVVALLNRLVETLVRDLPAPEAARA
jgi:DNA-binding MarR family transcriptional regulator